LHIEQVLKGCSAGATNGLAIRPVFCALLLNDMFALCDDEVTQSFVPID
jgi:hypothetical protein